LPRDELERSIAAIWGEVLGIEHIGINENFFERGGNSVHAAKVCARCRTQLGVDLSIIELFEKPTIAAIAAATRDRPAAAEDGITKYQGAAMTLTKFDECSLVTDLVEREGFKLRRLGIRVFPKNDLAIQLVDGTEPDELSVMAQRQNMRHFAAAPVKIVAFAKLLSCLRSRPLVGGWKYRYASAGSLYPVQVYLAVHREPVDANELMRATYYYDPVEHSLWPLVRDAKLDISMHAMINRPVFRESAFSLFLVSEQEAITPMYGGEALRFALLEAGMMSQLLDEVAPRCELGLCHIGGVDFEPYRELFRLRKSHVLLHSFLGGRRAESVAVKSSGGDTEYVEEIIHIN